MVYAHFTDDLRRVMIRVTVLFNLRELRPTVGLKSNIGDGCCHAASLTHTYTYVLVTSFRPRFRPP